MCGRFTLRTPAAALGQLFLFDPPEQAPPRFNIAPTQPVAAVRLGDDKSTRQFASLRWGLIPSWADDPSIGSRMINARAETVADKPAFRSAFRRRRCLVLADGYYEWKKEGSRKQPYLIHMADDRPFAFAGLWEHWEKGEEGPWETCTIITTEANDLTRALHDRMPVILKEDDHELWLDVDFEDRSQLQSLLRPYASDEMAYNAVSTHVNNPKNDDPKCVETV
jgi:putative SOS response-associated peptidase YedK